MNTEERGGMPPEPNEEKPRFVVGAKKNPDGTWDYSRAMEWKDPEGKLAKGFEESKKREKEARAERLEIPKDIKPGSAEMAWYTMRNTIIVNEEAANRARKEGNPDERREALIKAQKMQQTMFDNASMRFSQDLIKGGLDTGQSVTAEQARARAANLTANEMYDLVQKHVIDHYESLEDEGKDEAYLQEGHFGGNYPIKDLLKAARDLQSRLIDEASRGGKN
jgi:hypothetical protein